MPAGNIDIVGKALFAVVDLATGKPRVVKRIEWADGQSTDFPEPEKVQGVVNSQDGRQAGRDGAPISQNGPIGPDSPREVLNEPTGPAGANTQGSA